jgi:alginate O-acetyltransferase complex protein AlgI
MVFSSAIFLFIFLPVVLGCCLFRSLRLRNFWLLVFSIVFYAWGEVAFVFLMLASTVVNYFLGRWVDRETVPGRRRWAVGFAVGVNLGLLAIFKYTPFVMENLNWVLGCLRASPIRVPPVRLPIGISFFTFHALSYVIDVYRRKWSAAKNPADMALYIFFFPQLIAGPILRWSAIAPQIAQRSQSSSLFAAGIKRFAAGLAKKVLIANTLAGPADDVFKLIAGGRDVPPAVAWLGAVSYSLQIYFDFSGYSDMAIGLGKMFGFQFMENFDHPYIAQSVRDFWRRWHISLSSWFRDYLYIPLGGNRCSERRNHFNLLVVFFLCGLWHGASWTFVVWGLYHGVFLVLERSRFGQAIGQAARPLQHAYTLLVVLVGWVIFRAPVLSDALACLGNMVGLASGVAAARPLGSFLTRQIAWSLLAGLAFSMPLSSWCKRWTAGAEAAWPPRVQTLVSATGSLAEALLTLALLVISAAWLAGATYNPFIYFRF